MKISATCSKRRNRRKYDEISYALEGLMFQGPCNLMEGLVPEESEFTNLIPFQKHQTRYTDEFRGALPDVGMSQKFSCIFLTIHFSIGRGFSMTRKCAK